jgi:hypothetical protein
MLLATYSLFILVLHWYKYMGDKSENPDPPLRYDCMTRDPVIFFSGDGYGLVMLLPSLLDREYHASKTCLSCCPALKKSVFRRCSSSRCSPLRAADSCFGNSPRPSLRIRPKTMCIGRARSQALGEFRSSPRLKGILFVYSDLVYCWKCSFLPCAQNENGSAQGWVGAGYLFELHPDVRAGLALAFILANGAIKSVDPIMFNDLWVWRRNLGNRHAWLANMLSSQILIYEGLQIMFNSAVKDHNDHNDMDFVWALLIILGWFIGGEVEFPELGITVHPIGGDYLALRGLRLRHNVHPIHGGQRICIPTYTHRSSWSGANAPKTTQYGEDAVNPRYIDHDVAFNRYQDYLAYAQANGHPDGRGLPRHGGVFVPNPGETQFDAIHRVVKQTVDDAIIAARAKKDEDSRRKREAKNRRAEHTSS